MPGGWRVAADDRLLGIVLTRRDILATGACTALAAAGASPEAATAPAARAAVPAVPPKTEPRIDIVCRFCGGHNVARDAWAEWDAEVQDWVLGRVFDQGFCYDCDAESRLEEVDLIAGVDEEAR
jgi:hypothetical protein